MLTIAQALSGTTGDETLDYLPYPYRPADEEPGKEAEESGKNPGR